MLALYKLDLFDKMIKPVLLYGCEVWGFGKLFYEENKKNN